ncbi:Reverse transcriptase domain, partial [Trinorchestia longiramus]
FNGKFYKQIEGLGMGLPLGPTFANIFMCFNETKWLKLCPKEFQPVFYRRYIDDTFLLFREKSHATLFLDFINSKHPNIRFTMECENNNELPFLDCLVTRRENKFEVSVYRKNTFSGLGMSFFSYCTFRFKLNCIRTML